jgi:hypothetical protein
MVTVSSAATEARQAHESVAAQAMRERKWKSREAIVCLLKAMAGRRTGGLRQHCNDAADV